MERLRTLTDIGLGIRSAMAASGQPAGLLEIHISERAEKQLRAETQGDIVLCGRSHVLGVPMQRADEELSADWAIYCAQTGHLLAVAPERRRSRAGWWLLGLGFAYLLSVVACKVLPYG